MENYFFFQCLFHFSDVVFAVQQLKLFLSHRLFFLSCQCRKRLQPQHPHHLSWKLRLLLRLRHQPAARPAASTQDLRLFHELLERKIPHQTEVEDDLRLQTAEQHGGLLMVTQIKIRFGMDL